MAYQGLLTIDGVIRPNQFWPEGKADGDTVKITLLKGTKPFRFRKKPTGTASTVTLYDKARSHDSKTFSEKYSKNVVHDVPGKPNAGTRYVTIRMQGIDAPELHYKIYDGRQIIKLQDRKANIEYYQPLSASAATVIRRLIEAVGTDDELPCQFRTRIDKPDQAIDKYGRFVGDIFIKVGGVDVNVNNAMLEQGLALPAFYETMRREEVTEKIAASTLGGKVPNRLGKHYRNKVGTLNKALKFENLTKAANKNGFKVGSDKGHVILPKLFRRLVTFTILKDGKAQPKPPATYRQYLAQDSSLDEILLTKEFLKGGRRRPRSFLTYFKNDKLLLQPGEFVLRDAPSYLFTEKGTPISKW